MSLTTSQIINHWKVEVAKNYGSSRFTSSARLDILNMLFESLINNNINLEDASFLKREVDKFLVTDEGRKGKGRHKGWGDNVEMEFDNLLVEYYQNNSPIPKREYGTYPILDKHELITQWAIDKFGEMWNDELNLQAHTHGHRFNLEFQKDTFDKHVDNILD